MWVIRGGEHDELVVPFVEAGVIALPYPEVPDAEILTRSEIRRFLVGERTTAQLDADEALISAFVREIRDGESILLLDTSRGEVVVGTVTGRYEFATDPSAAAVPHQRTVEWLARHPVGDLPAAVQGVARQKPALQQDRSAEWAGYLAQVRDGSLGRDPKDRPVRTVPAPRTRASGTRKAPAAPRVKKPAIAQRTCPGCFLQTHPDRFVGDYCEDCAG